jgi:nucleoside-diphosphate-sugar epimerase
VRILVTGGAGFLGSHLCEAILSRGHDVVAVDNYATSTRETVDRLARFPQFSFVEADVCAGPALEGRFDAIAHLACPASPPEYLRLPLETLAIGSHGSEFVLRLARANSCRVLLASTSEVYGDPLVRPQREDYWGNVNPIGPRSVYDESKRYAEALFTAHRRAREVNTGIVRIFNTYGPGLRRAADHLRGWSTDQKLLLRFRPHRRSPRHAHVRPAWPGELRQSQRDNRPGVG